LVLKEHSGEAGAESWQKQIQDFEIFNIKGKGARKVWTEFLKGFGLAVYFIGDWDNISEVAQFDLAKYTAAYQKSIATAGAAVQQKGSADGSALFAAIDKVLASSSPDNMKELRNLKDYIVRRSTDFPKLIEHIKANDITEWNRLDKAIDDSYSQGVYVLRQGELEDYIKIQGKGLDQVIEFCQTRFDTWLTDSSVASHRTELLRVLGEIFR